jgi:hypothetical protein
LAPLWTRRDANIKSGKTRDRHPSLTERTNTRYWTSLLVRIFKLVRSHLARVGLKKGDLSKFVDDAVRAEVFRQTVKEVQAQNADLSEAQAMALANEAVTWARANPA